MKSGGIGCGDRGDYIFESTALDASPARLEGTNPCQMALSFSTSLCRLGPAGLEQASEGDRRLCLQFGLKTGSHSAQDSKLFANLWHVGKLQMVFVHTLVLSLTQMTSKDGLHNEDLRPLCAKVSSVMTTSRNLCT